MLILRELNNNHYDLHTCVNIEQKRHISIRIHTHNIWSVWWTFIHGRIVALLYYTPYRHRLMTEMAIGRGPRVHKTDAAWSVVAQTRTQAKSDTSRLIATGPDERSNVRRRLKRTWRQCGRKPTTADCLIKTSLSANCDGVNHRIASCCPAPAFAGASLRLLLSACVYASR